MTTKSLSNRKTDKKEAEPFNPVICFKKTLYGTVLLLISCSVIVSVVEYGAHMAKAIEDLGLGILHWVTGGLTVYFPLGIGTVIIFMFTAWRGCCEGNRPENEAHETNELFGIIYALACIAAYSLNWSVMNRAESLITDSFINQVFFYAIQGPVIGLVLFCIALTISHK